MSILVLLDFCERSVEDVFDFCFEMWCFEEKVFGFGDKK